MPLPKNDWTMYDTVRPEDMNAVAEAIEELQDDNDAIREELRGKANLSAPGAKNWDSGNVTVLNGSNLRIYVSPDGSDTEGDGSQAKPYQTIEAVFQRIIRATGNGIITVYFQDGTYELDKQYAFYGIGQHLRFYSISEDHTKVTLNITHDGHGLAFYGCTYVTFSGITVNVSNARPATNTRTIVVQGGRLLFRYGAVTSDVPQTLDGISAFIYQAGASGYIHGNEISGHTIAIQSDTGATVAAHHNTGTGNITSLYATSGIIMTHDKIPDATNLKIMRHGGQIFDNQA